MGKFRIYTTGALRYFDIEDEVPTVVGLYERAVDSGYITGMVQEGDDRARKVLVPLRAITLIADAED